MKKLQKWLIGLSILGVLSFGSYKIHKMKPKPQFLKKTGSKEVLESKLADSFEAEGGLGVVRYAKSDEEIFAVAETADIAGFSLDSSARDSSELSVRDIKTDADSLGELVESGILEKIAAKEYNGHLGELKQIKMWQLLSPVASPRNIIGIAYNYLEHAEEVGETEKFKGEKMVLFRKEAGSLCGPFADIKKPDEVRLLDYEVEIGMVIGKKINKNTVLTEDNFHEFIAGYTLVNDISARDIQLRGGTLFDKSRGFRRGKSYDGFCPTGPVFLYSNKSLDFDLEQYLVRQRQIYQLQEGNSSKMVNNSYEILKELQRRLNSKKEKEFRIFVDKEGNRNYSFEPGDLIATGTPAGVAFKFNIGYVIACRGKGSFIKFEEKNNEKYLRKGDLLITKSKSLGYQKHNIK